MYFAILFRSTVGAFEMVFSKFCFVLLEGKTEAKSKKMSVRLWEGNSL